MIEPHGSSPDGGAVSGALGRELRKGLAKAVRSARRIAEAGARAALDTLRVGAAGPDPAMAAGDRVLRRRLRAHGRALGDQRRGDEQETTRLVHEVAYEHWHRMLFARFLAENTLLIEPESGVPVTLDECRELARERGEDPWAMTARFAQKMLPEIFRPDDPALAVPLAPETRQALEGTLSELPVAVFRADDALGWTYQFWQADRKDEVNQSGVKIGADELPAVTQLFTEPYMVRFLFHNTVGTWRAAKTLARREELRTEAEGETDLRCAVRLEAAGGYDFDYLRFVREPAEEGGVFDGAWRPAAGSFSKWPRRAADLKVLDPCCGSGHFLVEGLHLFVRLRMEEEGLSVKEAVLAVLRDNLHGLEIDPRCAQIAAFALALAAWKLAGGVIDLPALNIACSGIAPNATKEEWMTLAERTAAPGRHLRGQPRPIPDRLGGTLAALHELFLQAPTLGSLIEPRSAGRRLFGAPFEALRPVLQTVLETGEAEPERRERAVAAAGMVRAVSLLAGRYSLVITNVPYLARGKHDEVLRTFADQHHHASKADLATMFVERAFGWLGDAGTQAFVVPQNWLFLKTSRKLREQLLIRRRWRFVARLGPGAFETIGGHVVNVALTILSAEPPRRAARIAGLDVSAPRGATQIRAPGKARMLRRGAQPILSVQAHQMNNPNAVLLISPWDDRQSLRHVAQGVHGFGSKDSSRFFRQFWEAMVSDDWQLLQTTVSESQVWSGCEQMLYWQRGKGMLAELGRAGKASPAGRIAWGRAGVAVSQIGSLPSALYTGEIFDKNTAVVLPVEQSQVPAVWAYCSSPEYARAVRELDQTLKVTNATLVEVPFDVEHWRKVANERYPHGLPEPYSNDPTQWLFHGHPCASVVWDTGTKRTATGPARTDPTVLQVAVARLLGYRWPAERDSTMRLAPEARAIVERNSDFYAFADADGIVCLPALRGEASAENRLRSLLAAAYGDAWSNATERRLLTEASPSGKPAASLDDWLRNHFFIAHCRLFHHRPFIWHVWDGLPGGFHALVNYHRLAAPHESRRTLESLTYSYLGDWTERQRAGQSEGVAGADARLAAALELKTHLERILAGEPPLDLFVRWKPLHEQPIGWEPDINDGVRLNIRPFLRAELRKGGRKGAGILRAKPNIRWTKDRGKEPQRLKPKGQADDPKEYRPRADFPWFWSCPGDGSARERTDFPGGPIFDGARWNDLHYTNAAKHAAREATRAYGQAPDKETSR